MVIDPDKIAALYRLSVDGNFTLAAKNLAISQPALSKKIARLEDELELTLVIRGVRSTKLTAAGQELIRYHKLRRELDLELASNLGLDYNSQLGGEVDIAVYSSVGRSLVLPRLAQLTQRFSRLRLNMMVREVYELEATLLTGEASFVLSTGPITRHGVVNKIIAEEVNVMIRPVAADYPDIFIDHDPSDQTTINFFRAQRRKFHGKRSYASDIYSIIDAVRQGFGRAVVSQHLVSGFDDIAIEEEWQPQPSPVYLSYFDRSYYSKLHLEVIEQLSLGWPG